MNRSTSARHASSSGNSGGSGLRCSRWRMIATESLTTVPPSSTTPPDRAAPRVRRPSASGAGLDEQAFPDPGERVELAGLEPAEEMLAHATQMRRPAGLELVPSG